MSNWKTLASVFPVDTRRLLGILLPDLLVDAGLLVEQLPTVPAPVLNANGKRYQIPAYRQPPVRIDIQTVSVGPGLYHLKVRIGEDWSPFMEPEALKLWLIVEHPRMFMVQG